MDDCDRVVLALMRIAMVTGSSYPPIDGIGVYSLSLGRYLVRRGHSVTIITRGTVRVNRADTEGVELVSLPFISVYPFHVHAFGYRVNRYLLKHRNRFDVFHAHSPLVPVLSDVRPVVTTLHSPLAEHRHRVNDLYSLLWNLQLPFSKRLERRLLRTSRSIAVVNPALAPMIAGWLGGTVPIAVLGNAVDTKRFVPDPAARDKDLVICVGRLQPGKGFDDLLYAWPQVVRRHSSARLCIVGNGPLRRRLGALAEDLKIFATVTFIGAIPRSESDVLIRLYQRAALVVQPSHHEGLSTVVLEAMAVGAPVVATSVGAHATVIEHGLNGVLVPPGDRHALATAISRVLASDDATGMGAHARETILTSYSWERIAEGYEEWYASVIDQ